MQVKLRYSDLFDSNMYSSLNILSLTCWHPMQINKLTFLGLYLVIVESGFGVML
jgi:hypothetical protein